MTERQPGGKAVGRSGTEAVNAQAGRGERRQDSCGDIWSWRRALVLLW